MIKITKSSEGFSLVEALLIILIIVIIGFGGYYVWHTQHKNAPAKSKTTNSQINKVTNNPSTSSVTGAPNTATIIEDVRQALGNKFTIDNSTTNPSGAGSISLNSTSGGPASPVGGYNYYIDPSGGVELAIRPYQSSPSTQPSSTTTATIQSLISGVFSKDELNPIPNRSGTGSLANYENGTAVCLFNFTQDPSYPEALSCADESVYSATGSATKPLMAAYLTVHPQPLGGPELTIGPPTIKTSVTAGYKFATMAIDDSLGYFYQKNGMWYLYADGQDGMYCNFSTNSDTSLNNNDARLAFLGQPCQAANGTQSTVQ